MRTLNDGDAVSLEFEEVWILRDARNPTKPVVCRFPNAATVERAIKTMLRQRPECAACPSDFSFVYEGDLAFDGVELVWRNANDTVVKEFADYASCPA